LDEIVRDAPDSMTSLRSRVWRWLVALVAAGLSAGVANEVSESTALVVLVTMVGLAIGYAATMARPMIRAARHPRREHHWRSQVYQGAPDSVEFDLWSDCNHQIAAVRAEVIEPDGTIVPSQRPHLVRERTVPAGDYVAMGTYPHDFVRARPLRPSEPYEVIWYGRRAATSRWMEIARQRFVAPIAGGRIVQARP
jgi:hypothetical protein